MSEFRNRISKRTPATLLADRWATAAEHETDPTRKAIAEAAARHARAEAEAVYAK